MKHLLVINGHPDSNPARFCGALTDAYIRGGKDAGWLTRRLDVADLRLSSIEAMKGDADVDVLAALNDIEWANRIAVVFPLWFDRPPAALRALFGHLPRSRRRAHVIITMEMPAFAYRSLLRAGGPANATGLAIPGVVSDEPVLIGCVNTISSEQRREWLETVRQYGERTRHGTTAAPSRPLALASMIDRTVGQWWNGFA